MFRLVCSHCTHTCIKKKLALQISTIKYMSSRYKSYYQDLGLDSTASAKDIKAAYYKLSLKFHPDKNQGSEESVAKFREITEAYEVLGNPEKKRKYDQNYWFQPYFNSRYSKTGNYYRPSNYQGPYTGRTKDFDYDEHFKKHYHDYHKQREIEYEYFRRRWEADFNRRYRNFDDKHDESFENFQRRLIKKQSPFSVMLAIWTVFLIIYVYRMIYNPDNIRVNHGPLYYKVSSANDDSEVKIISSAN